MTIKQEDFLRIIRKVGMTPAEFDYYYGLYSTTTPDKLAVIKISGSCIDNSSSLESIAEDISDLYTLNFLPIITYGWGLVLTQNLAEAGIPNSFVNGDRFTDDKVMPFVQKASEGAMQKLYDAMQKRGVKIQKILPQDSVIIAQDKTQPRYGNRNGDIVAINKAPVLEALEQGMVPILSPIGISQDHRKLYNLNSATVGARIVIEFDTEKHIMITGTPGITRKDGSTIPEIVLRRDYQRLVTKGIVSGGALKNLDEIKLTLETRKDGEDKSSQIVSPGNLVMELYTKKGADNGTFVRQGYYISIEPMEICRKRAENTRSLIEKAFNARLRPGFFNEPKIAFFEGRNKGVAYVLRKAEHGVCGLGHYLDLIAVDCELKGKGLSKDIFDAILNYQPQGVKNLFWRSQTKRPARKFYLDISDGHQKYTGMDGKEYACYWIGLSHEQIKKAIEFARNRPSNFEQK